MQIKSHFSPPAECLLILTKPLIPLKGELRGYSTPLYGEEEGQCAPFRGSGAFYQSSSKSVSIAVTWNSVRRLIWSAAS